MSALFDKLKNKFWVGEKHHNSLDHPFFMQNELHFLYSIPVEYHLKKKVGRHVFQGAEQITNAAAAGASGAGANAAARARASRRRITIGLPSLLSDLTPVLLIAIVRMSAISLSQSAQYAKRNVATGHCRARDAK